MQDGIHGLMAALPTPLAATGSPDFDALHRVADFALANGVRGLVPCGGTGEYFQLTAEDRQAVLEQVLEVARGRGPVIAGVGASSVRDSLRLAEHALTAGASAVLLPPPHFYRYGDADLADFYRQAARGIGGPVLLYNLAAFVSAISADTAADLIASEPNVLGIKDSSGSLDILRRLTLDGVPSVRIQGHDLVLADSLLEGVADGAISGPASVVPELSASLFATFGHETAFTAASDFYREFIGRIEEFPYPWALKWIAESRGLCKATLPFVPGRARQASARRFRNWFDGWLERLLGWRQELVLQ